MSRFIDKTSVQYNNNPKDLILYDDKIVLADDKKESVFLLSNLNKAIVSGSKIKFKNVIGFRFQTNEDASKYCEIINNLISNWHNNNFNSNEEAHHDKQNLAKGKQYCRICNAEISTGTLCSECLKTANEELLTVAERKQRNEKIDSERCLFVCFGIVSVIMGIFIMIIVKFVIGLIVIGVGILFFIICWSKKESVCSACQRRDTMQKVHSELVGTRDTYVKETRRIQHTKRGGSININPDYDEYEVDVPATEYYYDVTYKCTKCGNVEVRRETQIRKD